MTLPFSDYNQLRCRGNEYVTDQTLNRPFYRFFQNDLYLDTLITAHTSDDLIHNTGGASRENETQLTGDRLVILSCGYNPTTETDEVEDVFEDVFDGDDGQLLGIYVTKSWQTLVDEQPRNLGGHTLIFRVQKNEGSTSNPAQLYIRRLSRTLRLAGFYGGTLIFESPPAFGINPETSTPETHQTGSSAANQKICLVGGEKSSAVLSFEKCQCKTIIRNCKLVLDNLLIGSGSAVSGWASRDNLDFDKVYVNDLTDAEQKRLAGECMIKPSTTEVWTSLNVNKALNISDCNDVVIKHCCIGY